jgi:DNA-binding response OmpR family regulator
MQVWDDASFVEDNTLSVNVRRVREKSPCKDSSKSSGSFFWL